MRSFIVVIACATFLAGCQSASSIASGEMQKISQIQIGMSVTQVKSIMGTDPISISIGDEESRPLRIDRFKAKSGESIEIYFYRSSVKRQDGVCTDDETTAVVFVNGKVDSITNGDRTKQVVEVRFR